jgi:DNA-binding CsgD family transcriptional regulator
VRTVVALSAIGPGIGFVLATAAGERIRGGDFTEERPESLRGLIDIVVLADYDLLDAPAVALLAARPAQLHLIPPGQPVDTADEVLSRWLHGRPTVPADTTRTAEIALYLAERRSTVQRLQQTRTAIVEQLRSASPAYAALLERDGSFDQRLLPILLRYPTPRSLRTAGPIQLGRLLHPGSASDRRSLLNSLVSLGETEVSAQLDRHRFDFVEALLPSLIREHSLFASRLSAIDQAIYAVAQAADMERTPLPPSDDTDWLSVAPVSRLPEDEPEPDDLLRFARSLQATLYQPPIASEVAFRRYRRARAASPGSELDPIEAVEIERIGQRLAYAAGDLTRANRHRANADSLAEQLRFELPARPRTDGEFLNALIDCDAVDTAVGVRQLSHLLSSERAFEASPELVTEAQGLVALILALLGDRDQAVECLTSADRGIAVHRLGGTARATADIARLTLVGSSVGAERAGFDEYLQTADHHSRGSAYRSFFNYAVMLTSYVSGDSERAVRSYAEIRQEGRWPRYNQRFERMSRLSLAIIQAARGQFSATHSELAALAATHHDAIAAPEMIIHRLLSRRLELAAGNLREVLADTAPSNPLWSEHLQRSHPRYVPAALMIRGTALWRDGMEQAGAGHFLRATEQAVRQHDFLSLAVTETGEYRRWLQGLDRTKLPPSIPADVVDALLQRPILINRSLPTLTEQQSRILNRLAIGQSAASIAVELGITHNTLKTHLRQLYRRLGVSSREQAVIIAEEYGLVR